MLIPLGHENLQARRLPMITLGLIAINFVAFFLTIGALSRESPELNEVRLHIVLLASMHPDLNMTPAAKTLVDDYKKRFPKAWDQGMQRDPEDAWDVRVRLIEEPEKLQAEMDQLTARLEELHANSFIEKYCFVPAHPTWYSYITNAFLHGGVLHIIGNMWFLYLAGVVLEDTWGRLLYTGVYLGAAVFATLVHGWFNAGSNMPSLGASGAVAALMGAFLVRYPTTRIKMLLWLPYLVFTGIRSRIVFYAAAYWLLPVWILMELFSGAVLGKNSGGVAHMAHIGGFAFGMAAAAAIRYSGIEQVINQGIEDEVDPTHQAEIDGIHDLAITENRPDEALPELEKFLAAYPESEGGLALEQEIHWRKGDMAAYAKSLEKLCSLHLKLGETERAVGDYQKLAESGVTLPAVTWLKLCQSLEAKQEYERALGEYQELAFAYPEERQSLLALMGAARLAMNKMNRPQHALNLYAAAEESAVPHLDLDSSIQIGMKHARLALEHGAAAAGK